MKVRGDVQPSNAFLIEKMPKSPGKVRVRFFENVEPFSEQEGDLTISGYQYDEYTLEFYDSPTLFSDILNNYDGFMAQAKLNEANEKTISELLDEVDKTKKENDALASQLTDTQLALCDVYELIIGG